jgi:hypothetical protein
MSQTLSNFQEIVQFIKSFFGNPPKLAEVNTARAHLTSQYQIVVAQGHSLTGSEKDKNDTLKLAYGKGLAALDLYEERLVLRQTLPIDVQTQLAHQQQQQQQLYQQQQHQQYGAAQQVEMMSSRPRVEHRPPRYTKEERPPPAYVDRALEVCLEENKQLKLKNNRLAVELKDCKEEVHEGVQQGGGGGKRARVGGNDLRAQSRPSVRSDANHVRMTRILTEKLHVPHEELIPQTADILVAHGITDWNSFMMAALSGREPTSKERRKQFEKVLREWGIHKAHADRIVWYAEVAAGPHFDKFDYDWNKYIMQTHTDPGTHPRHW